MNAQYRRSLILTLGIIVLGGVWGWHMSIAGAESPTTDTSVTAPQSSDDSKTMTDEDRPDEAAVDMDKGDHSEQKATQPSQPSPQSQDQEQPAATY